MVLEMKIPSPGESITEVEISQWMVKDGDIVSKDQTIAEIDSDKATLDLPAEASGKITFKAEEGDTMSVGDIVCLIDTSQVSVISESSDDMIKDNTQHQSPNHFNYHFHHHFHHHFQHFLDNFRFNIVFI